MQFTRFATALMVDSPAACRDFFVAALGCEVAVDLGWYVDLNHPSDKSFTLDFVEVGHPSMPKTLGRTEGVVLALVVDDAHAQLARLKSLDVDILTDIRDEPWGQRHFFVTTPGPVVEIVQQTTPDPAWMAANNLT